MECGHIPSAGSSLFGTLSGTIHDHADETFTVSVDPRWTNAEAVGVILEAMEPNVPSTGPGDYKGYVDWARERSRY